MNYGGSEQIDTALSPCCEVTSKGKHGPFLNAMDACCIPGRTVLCYSSESRTWNPGSASRDTPDWAVL
eukprot:880417-Pelagomonas_calceolata.AAC.1